MIHFPSFMKLARIRHLASNTRYGTRRAVRMMHFSLFINLP